MFNSTQNVPMQVTISEIIEESAGPRKSVAEASAGARCTSEAQNLQLFQKTFHNPWALIFARDSPHL
jgi:hypothetical protein